MVLFTNYFFLLTLLIYFLLLFRTKKLNLQRLLLIFSQHIWGVWLTNYLLLLFPTEFNPNFFFYGPSLYFYTAYIYIYIYSPSQLRTSAPKFFGTDVHFPATFRPNLVIVKALKLVFFRCMSVSDRFWPSVNQIDFESLNDHQIGWNFSGMIYTRWSRYV